MAAPITIKRYTNSSWESYYPITAGQNVYGSGTKATTSLLDSNNKLARDFLQLYEHNITITYSNTIYVTFKFTNTTSTAYTSADRNLSVALYNAGFTRTGSSSSYSYDEIKVETGVK